MKMNRRNVLIGLGTAVVGGGAAFGSGAFTSVEAERSVEVGSAGDSSALLDLSISGDLQGSGNTINFNLSNDVNLDAVTRFDGVFTITNNGDNSVYVEILDGTSDTASDMIDYGSGAGTGDDMTFEPEDDATDPVEIAASGNNDNSETFDVIFDLTTVTDTNNASIPTDIVIKATDSQP